MERIRPIRHKEFRNKNLIHTLKNKFPHTLGLYLNHTEPENKNLLVVGAKINALSGSQEASGVITEIAKTYIKVKEEETKEIKKLGRPLRNLDFI